MHMKQKFFTLILALLSLSSAAWAQLTTNTGALSTGALPTEALSAHAAPGAALRGDDIPADRTMVVAFTKKVTPISDFGSEAELFFPYMSMLGIVDQEQRDGLTIFKDKKSGKELMEYNAGAKTVTVCDGVTEADNILYEIPASLHSLIAMMNKGVDPLSGYDYLYFKFAVESTGIGTLEQESRGAGAWYTLGGVRLTGEPQQKGVYIRDGKKIAVP